MALAAFVVFEQNLLLSKVNILFLKRSCLASIEEQHTGCLTVHLIIPVVNLKICGKILATHLQQRFLALSRARD
jgi:hypothetical protein